MILLITRIGVVSTVFKHSVEIELEPTRESAIRQVQVMEMLTYFTSHCVFMSQSRLQCSMIGALIFRSQYRFGVGRKGAGEGWGW